MKSTVRIHLIIDEHLLERADMAAAKTQMTRSRFVVIALKEYLYSRQVLLHIDPTTMSDDEVKEAYRRISREYSHRVDPNFYR